MQTTFRRKNRSSRNSPAATAFRGGGWSRRQSARRPGRRLTAEPGELAILQDVQQLGLQRGRHLADLVQEDRAVVGELELAWLCLQGAAEGAALEPEHLRLEQVARQGGAVDLDKCPGAPG